MAACLAVLLTLSVAAGTVAHEGGPRLLAAPDRVPPGGVVEVRGEDLGADAEVTLFLVGGAGGEVRLAEAVADGEGHVLAALALPPDLPVGGYVVRATVTGSGAKLDASITVEGSPVVVGGEPGGKDEDDLLLVAVPSGWQRSLSGPIVTARPLTETLPAGSGVRGTPVLLVAVLAVILGLGAAGTVLASRIRAERRSRRD